MERRPLAWVLAVLSVMVFVLVASIATATLAIQRYSGVPLRMFDIADALLIVGGVFALVAMVRLAVFIQRTLANAQRVQCDAEQVVQIASKANDRLLATSRELAAPLGELVLAVKTLRGIRANNDDELNALATIVRSSTQAETLTVRLLAPQVARQRRV